MKNHLIVVLAVAVFGIVGLPSTVFAEECPDRHETTDATNAEYLEKGRKLAAEALEHAKQGHGAEAKKSGYAALDALACIVTSRAGAQLQNPTGKLRRGSIHAGKDEMDKAVAMLEEAVAKLNKVELIR